MFTICCSPVGKSLVMDRTGFVQFFLTGSEQSYQQLIARFPSSNKMSAE